MKVIARMFHGATPWSIRLATVSYTHLVCIRDRFREHILPAFENAEKVSVVQEDAYEYAAHMSGEGYDYALSLIHI